MIRTQTLIWLALIAVASAVLFHVSYQVRALEGALGQVNRQIVREQETIRVLQAEWAMLNQPERLRMLAGEAGELEPMRADQMIASLEAVPAPLEGPEYAPAPPEVLALLGLPAVPVPTRSPVGAAAPARQTASVAQSAPATPAEVIPASVVASNDPIGAFLAGNRETSR